MLDSDALSRPREQILDATLALLAEQGAESASLRRIGAAAGLHNSSLFHYFPSKRAIHDALAERVVSAARACLVPPLGAASPRIEDLLAGLGDLAEHLAGRPHEAAYLTQAVVSGGLGPYAEARSRMTEELLRPLWEWLVRARDAGEIRSVRPQPATLQLIGLVLVEPAFAGLPRRQGLRPAARARRREIESWVRATLARR